MVHYGPSLLTGARNLLKANELILSIPAEGSFLGEGTEEHVQKSIHPSFRASTLNKGESDPGSSPLVANRHSI